MSGGVDSSVAAMLLKKQGYDVIGVTMQIWQDEEEAVKEANGGCCGLSAVDDARRVAERLEIPYYVMNFKKEFKCHVMDYFVDEYLRGHTPNPCIACNRYVKWESLLQRSLEIGADYIATGHYARIDRLPNGRFAIRNVSNFQIGDIENLIKNCEIKPMVNQILLHISNTPTELVDYCQKNGIVVEAYSPIAHGEILKQPEIAAMAEKYGVTVPQLCIRYTIQLGVVSLPKTANPEHMKTNAEVDFEIRKEDMEVLKNFKHIENYGESSGFPVYGGKM